MAGRRDPPPMRTNDVAVVLVGTALWALAFLVLLATRERWERSGRLWWLGACAAGVGLGLAGLAYVRRRDAAIAREAHPAADDRTS